MDKFGKLLQDWLAADVKAASAERRVTESGDGASTALVRDAQRLREAANRAREKVAHLVLTDADVGIRD